MRGAKGAGAQLLAHAGKELFHVLNVRGPGYVVKLLEAILLHETQAFSFPLYIHLPFLGCPLCINHDVLLSHFD